MQKLSLSNQSEVFRTLYRIVILLSGPLFSNSLMAENAWKRSTMFGDLNGSRTALSEQGISFEAIYTRDITRNVSGGIKRKTEYLDNWDLTLSFDAEKLIGWDGATFYFYVLGNHGANPSANNVGDSQVFSNIESPDTWKLYEAWYEQQFFGDRLSLKMGLYDVNSEFDVIDTAGLFLNSSHGIGPDFSQSGKNGPSIFPTTSPGARLFASLTDRLYFQFVMLDGVPGIPDRLSGTHVDFDDDDGALLVAESGFLNNGANANPYTKLALGTWYYTADSVENASGDPIAARNNRGLYLFAERSIYQEPDHPEQGLAVFARYGIADSRINQFDRYFGSGIVYTGLFPGRDLDKLGLAVAVAINSDEYRQSGSSIDSEETAWELSYRAQITPWLAIQPDIQYIINPGTDASLDDATVVTTRFELTF